jgi:hypothetical protein
MKDGVGRMLLELVAALVPCLSCLPSQSLARRDCVLPGKSYTLSSIEYNLNSVLEDLQKQEGIESFFAGNVLQWSVSFPLSGANAIQVCLTACN